MIRIREAIVVEGRYDKIALENLVDAPIFVTDGFHGMGDREMLHLLRRAAETRGLIILTDSDGAGFVIRNRLKSSLPREKVLHAYIPDLPGKERRKKKPSREGLLGVEGMEPAVLADALRRAGAHFLEEDAENAAAAVTRQDLYTLGLMGGPDSSRLRNRIKQQLGLPAHLGTSGFLDALNLVTDREGLEKLLAETETGTSR